MTYMGCPARIFTTNQHELAVRKPFLTFKFHEIRKIMKVFRQISE